MKLYELKNLKQQYDKDTDKNLCISKIEYIENIIDTHEDWEKSPDNSQKYDVLSILLYEYATGIEKITSGKVQYTEVLKKMDSLMGKMRFGEWKENDSNLEYDGISVTSDEYKNGIQKNFGAQVIPYIDENKKLQKAVIAYGYNDETKSGIDLNNLNDLRHTLFHEWTHIMESQKVQDELSEETVNINGRIIKNNEMMPNGEIWGDGIKTIEYYNNEKIMHNQIDEGMVELISRKIMEVTIGKDEISKNIDENRYSTNTKIAQYIMNRFGEQNTIEMFINNPQKLIYRLENIQIDKRDALHYMSDFIIDQRGEGKIPEYSPKTMLLNNALELLTQFGINDKNEHKEIIEYLIKNQQENYAIFPEKYNIVLTDEQKENFESLKNLNAELMNDTKHFYETLESKLKNMYHISSRVPEGEEYLKPNIPKIRKNFNHAFLYATSKPNYTYMFRQGKNGKNDNIENFYEFSLNGIDGIVIVTSDIEQARAEIGKKSFKLYTIDGSEFDWCGKTEYSSRVPAKILDEKNIEYNDLLKNLQVFYIDKSKLNMDEFSKLSEYYRSMIDEPEQLKDLFKNALNEGLVIYENEVQNVNYNWLNNNTEEMQRKSILLDNEKKLQYDILINADEIDYDCVQIKDISEPALVKFKSKSGKRVDVIQCKDLEENSILNNGKPSYQSIEMMIAVNGKSNSSKGEELIKKSRADYPKEYMKKYYYHFSQLMCNFASQNQYPYSLRGVMLLRTLREFYPKAEALSKINDYDELVDVPSGVKILNDDEKNMYSILEKNLEIGIEDEELLQKISHDFTENLKGKLDIDFTDDILKKLKELGVEKYLNLDLKNEFINAVKSSDENSYMSRLSPKAKNNVLQSGIEATEFSTRTGKINEQVENIKQIIRERDEKDEKGKGMVVE